jgi:hypothetical protein
MSVWKETGDDGSSPTIAQTQGAELSMETRTTGTGAAITPSEIRDLATPLTDDASIDPLLHRSVMPDSFFWARRRMARPSITAGELRSHGD